MGNLNAHLTLSLRFLNFTHDQINYLLTNYIISHFFLIIQSKQIISYYLTPIFYNLKQESLIIQFIS